MVEPAYNSHTHDEKDTRHRKQWRVLDSIKDDFSCFIT
jgi:hypothetical protein